MHMNLFACIQVCVPHAYLLASPGIVVMDGCESLYVYICVWGK